MHPKDKFPLHLREKNKKLGEKPHQDQQPSTQSHNPGKMIVPEIFDRLLGVNRYLVSQAKLPTYVNLQVIHIKPFHVIDSREQCV